VVVWDLNKLAPKFRCVRGVCGGGGDSSRGRTTHRVIGMHPFGCSSCSRQPCLLWRVGQV
jgi:hypothetical protein